MSATVPNFWKRLESRIALALARADAATAALSSLAHHTASTNPGAIGPAANVTFAAPSFTPRTGKVRINAIVEVSGGTLVATNLVSAQLWRDGALITGSPIQVSVSATASGATATVSLMWEDTVTVNTAHVWAVNVAVSDGSGHTIEIPVGGGSAGGLGVILLQELL